MNQSQQVTLFPVDGVQPVPKKKKKRKNDRITKKA